MPTDPAALHAAIARMGESLVALRSTTSRAQAAALGLLEQAAAAPVLVKASVESTVSGDAGVRCAVPRQEALSLAQERPLVATHGPLLAVDGSQVFPDRHAELLFAIINVGSILYEPGTGAAPSTQVETQLLYGDLLNSARGLLSEGDLALLRDSAERRSLLAHLPPGTGCIAVMDGPLELWGQKDATDPGAFEHALERFLSDLHELYERGCTVAGYVDKPSADLVVRMLEIFQDASGSASDRARVRPLRGVTDRWLFSQLLRPGDRSAVFALQSSSRHRYGEDLKASFFYLRVGAGPGPAIARVEIPEWVARDAEAVAALHSALMDQCGLLGERPYPYMLHRAHEIARISSAEQEQIRLRLLLEMRNRGLEPEAVSAKASAKQVAALRRSR